MTEEIKEALDAITPAPAPVEKIPAGKMLVGIDLWRDPEVSGKLTTRVGFNAAGEKVRWRPFGRIVVLSGGNVVAANWIAAKWVDDKYHLVGARATWCTKCTTSAYSNEEVDGGAVGDVSAPVMAPYAVWNGRDSLRKTGEDKKLKGMSMWAAVKAHGICDCGYRVIEDMVLETKLLTSFKNEVLSKFSALDRQLGRFVPPTMFTLVSVGKGKLAPCWDWMQAGLRAAKEPHEAVPYKSGDHHPFLYNPGRWMGWVDSVEELGELILPGGIDGRQPHQRQIGKRVVFTPAGCDGL